eukprot:scaffold280125_cov29-Prasinocladus_malaysianus.AAC.1
MAGRQERWARTKGVRPPKPPEYCAISIAAQAHLRPRGRARPGRKDRSEPFSLGTAKDPAHRKQRLRVCLTATKRGCGGHDNLLSQGPGCRRCTRCRVGALTTNHEHDDAIFATRTRTVTSSAEVSDTVGVISVPGRVRVPSRVRLVTGTRLGG